MDGVTLLHVAATALLNAGFAWLTGSLLARTWLGPILPPFVERLRRAERTAALACLLGGAGAILAAAARMGDTGLRDALPMWWPVASGTDYGGATLLAVVAVFGAAACIRWWVVCAAGLLVFALARASVSHGGEGGVLSADCVVQALHLLLIAAWLGGVALAGWVILPGARRHAVAVDGYLDRLSHTATLALAGIVLTGAWNSWQRLSAPAELWSHPYGMLLAFKLALFMAGAMLGGWNRLFGFPRAKAAAPDAAVRVLRIESAVLVGALIAAAALVAQQPPT